MSAVARRCGHLRWLYFDTLESGRKGLGPNFTCNGAERQAEVASGIRTRVQVDLGPAGN